MSDERELIAEREKKVQEIRELGANPYANGFTPTHTAAELQAKFAGAEPPPPVEDKAAPPNLISDEHFKVADGSRTCAPSARRRSRSCSIAPARSRCGSGRI